MADADLILLHAPSVYDFRTKSILHGPVSDVVPSTQIFEMYPIGFMTILEYLQRHGFSVRIINVALRMLRDRHFDAERLIRSLSPVAFGIDLHWLVHAQGSLEIARIAKERRPEVPVIFGGLSASYFHEELVRYPQVDYVVRGDSTEEPLRRLMSVLRDGGEPAGVPNLTWKDGGEVRVNALAPPPGDLNDVSFDYGNVMRSCVKYLDFHGHVPFASWFRYPIVAALTCRGCRHDCTVCGGSASAFRRICGRDAPAHRSPERIARDIASASKYLKAPIIVLGDVLQAGEGYGLELMRALKAERVTNHLAFEFFVPPSREFLAELAAAVPNFDIQISPESHDEAVRRRFGRPYGNAELERFIGDAMDLGCKRLDVFFMIGVPGQTAESVRGTVAYCRELLGRFGSGENRGRLHPYISPLAPFLDPGSRAFEDPEGNGYRLFHRSLEEHRRALLEPSWKHTLNYETEWMSRDEIVEVTYEAALELGRMKLKFGLAGRPEAEVLEARVLSEKELVGEIDRAVTIKDAGERERRVRELMEEFNPVGPSTLCEKDEMNWPVGLLRFNPLRILQAIFSRSG